MPRHKQLNDNHEVVTFEKSEWQYLHHEMGTFTRCRINVEIEKFRCKTKTKMVELTSWDFNYCPFCGKEIKQ